jgi:arylformamidase
MLRSEPFAMSRIIDVTVPLSADVPTFPGDPRFQMEFSHRIADGKPYNVAKVTMGVHSGTHVDAPYHFLAAGATVEALPLEILMGKVLVVQVTARECIDLADVQALDLTDEIRVLFKTRMSGQLRSPEFQEDFVYLTPAAAAHLVQAGIKLVGIDYLSVEKFQSPDFATHHALLGAGVVVVEGLDLSEADPGEYDMVCLPLRMVGADGSPARVVLRKRL